MLKPMTKKTNNTIIWIVVGVLILAGIITLIISFSSANAGESEVNAAYTSAAETLSAQQLTLQAASPTVTPTLFTPTASLTPTLFVTNTLPVLISPTTSTGGSTGGGSTAVGCDNSAFVADVTIPDNTVMTPGQVFKKTWKLQNTGTCPWTTAYKVTFLSGNQMNGVADPITVEVAPGQSADVSVSMTASATGGGTGYWILTNANGQQFGTNFYVIINVSGSATTGAATATSTTGAPASTATFTSTTAPSATPTVTSTP